MHTCSRKTLKPIACVVLAFFGWFCIEPWNYAKAAPNPPKRERPTVSRAPSVSQRLEGTLRSLKHLSEKLDARLSETQEMPEDMDQLEIFEQDIESAELAIQEEFKRTEDRIGKAGLPAGIMERLDAARTICIKEFKELHNELGRIKQIRQDLKQAKQRKNLHVANGLYKELKEQIKKLRTHLKEKIKEPTHTPLNPDALPHRTPKPTNRKPRLKKEEFTELQRPIQLAFNGDPSTLMLAQAPADVPTPLDSAETPEVQFSLEIQVLADQLEKDPIKIYEFVRNNFNFEPTFGSIKGAQQTLLEKSGNAMDLASLMISLLRVSGFPARYVMGTVVIPIKSVMNWVGVHDATAAASLLASGGIPGAVLNDDAGEISHIRIEHTWVAAYVDYVPSRGTVQKQGDTWVELDPAFKQFERTEGIGFNQILTFDPGQFINQFTNTGTINSDDGSATGFDETLIDQKLLEVRQTFENSFLPQNPDATIGDLLGVESIEVKDLGLLPASLPYRVLVRGSTISEIPDDLRHKLRFQVVSENGSPALDLLENLVSLAGKRVTLAYVPSDQQDRLTIEAHFSEENLPAYLVNVSPIIRIAGTTMTTGSAISLGSNQELLMEFIRPFSQREVIRNTITAGGYYAIGLDNQTIPGARIDQLLTEAKNLKNDIETDIANLSSADEVIGRFLEAAIVSYFAELDISMKTLASFFKVVQFKPSASSGIASMDLKVNTLFDVPISVVPNGGISLDVDRVVTVVEARTGEVTVRRGFVQTAGFLSSSLESEVLRQLSGEPTTEAVSTTVVLRTANLMNIPVFRIDQSNAVQLLPRLKVSSAVLEDVADSVNAGRVVTIPERELSIGSWSGIGYIVEDSETRSAAYLISGGLAGAIATILNFSIALGEVAFPVWLGFMVGLIAAALVPISGILLATAFALYGLWDNLRDIANASKKLNEIGVGALAFLAFSGFLVSLLLIAAGSAIALSTGLLLSALLTAIWILAVNILTAFIFRKKFDSILFVGKEADLNYSTTLGNQLFSSYAAVT